MRRIGESPEEFFRRARLAGMGLSVDHPTALPTARYTAAPATSSTSAGVMPGSGGAVAVTAPGGAPVTIGGARTPLEIGNSILVKEAGMVGATTSDKPCAEMWTVLLFDVPCDQALSLVFVPEYLEAQQALRTLAEAPDPVLPGDKANYVGFVGAYAWLMSWASGLENAALPYSGAGFLYDGPAAPGMNAFSVQATRRDGTTYRSRLVMYPGLGMARSVGAHPGVHGDLPITISQLNLNRCDPAVWAGAINDGSGVGPTIGRTVIGVAPVWSTSDGDVRVAAARVVAEQLANYDVLHMWVDAFATYAGLVDLWKSQGLPVNLASSELAQAGLALQSKRTWEAASAVGTAVGTAGATLGPAKVLADIFSGIVKVFSWLPAASGAVPCPRSFLYRSSNRDECSGSSAGAGGAEHVVQAMNPITASLVAAKEAAAARRESAPPATKSSTTPWIVGGAVGASILLLALFARNS